MAASDVLSVVTCAKQGDRFIPLDELTSLKLKEPLYVDGSIRLTAWGRPLVTDADWTDVVQWWAGMSDMLRDLSNGTRQRAEVRFDWPGSVLFEVDGERLVCTYCGPETKSATLDRIPALRVFMEEYERFFERMQVISPRGNRDYDVALDYMKYFKQM